MCCVIINNVTAIWIVFSSILSAVSERLTDTIQKAIERGGATILKGAHCAYPKQHRRHFNAWMRSKENRMMEWKLRMNHCWQGGPRHVTKEQATEFSQADNITTRADASSTSNAEAWSRKMETQSHEIVFDSAQGTSSCNVYSYEIIHHQRLSPNEVLMYTMSIWITGYGEIC